MIASKRFSGGGLAQENLPELSQKPADLSSHDEMEMNPGDLPTRITPSANPDEEDATTPLDSEGRARVLREPVSGFAAGEIVGGRWRLVKRLGVGGMGEVFEAVDVELGEPVAVKTLRPDLAADPELLERFRREVLLARRVTHPNICRVHDLEFHDVKENRIPFLVMELLGGETLADLLRRGPLAPELAIQIADACADALAAAHRAGVLHRDFKSGNVMLVPSAGEYRVVVTDFGLARTLSANASATAIVGTPAYMAPEQIQGLEITAATDVYAFGIVLFEMASGRRPFVGDTPIAQAIQRLQSPAPRLRDVRPTADPAWEKVIARCLERDPSRRYPDPREAVKELRQRAEKSAARSVRTRRPVWRTVAAILILAGALIGGWWRLAGRAPSRTTAAAARNTPASSSHRVAVRTAVAFLPLRNLSGHTPDDWLSTAFQESLGSEVSAGGEIRLVPGEDVLRAFGQSGAGTEDSAPARERLARDRGASRFVTGSYAISNGKLRLDLRVVDAAGAVISSASAEGSVDNIFEISAAAGARLRNSLGVTAPAESEPSRIELPQSAESGRLYAEGLTSLRLLRGREAREKLERVVQLEPGFLPGREALSEAFSILGEERRSAAEAKAALALSSGAPRELVLRLEGRAALTAYQWSRAIEAYRALFTLHPDRIDLGLRLIEAQLGGGANADAARVVADLRALPAPLSGDPRIDLAAARQAQAVGNSRDQRTYASMANAKAEALGAGEIRGWALLLEGSAAWQASDFDLSIDLQKRASALFSESGDAGGEARAALYAGAPLFSLGRFDEALQKAELAGSLAQKAGNRRTEGEALNLRGNIEWNQGDLAKAAASLGKACDILGEIGAQGALAMSETNLAQVAALRGEPARQMALLESAQRHAESVGDRSQLGATSLGLGEALLARADQKTASLLEAALTKSRETGKSDMEPYVLNALARAELAAGRAAEADRRAEEAQRLADSIHAAEPGAEARVTRARAALASGDAAKALTLSDQAGSFAEKAALAGSRADALLASVDALLSLARPEDARERLVKAKEIAGKQPSLEGRLRLEMREATMNAAAGRKREAVDALDRLISQAKKNELVAIQLEARARRARATGDAAALAAVRTEVSQRGMPGLFPPSM